MNHIAASNLPGWAKKSLTKRVVAVLLLAAVVLGSVAWLRGPEYDEAYSLFLTAGDARPPWPAGVFHPGDERALYAGHAGFGQIAHDLRAGDVHPPLYFWSLEVWRRVFGPSWFAARLLSVVYTLGALAALGWLAALVEVPVVLAMLVALLSFGFAYTGIVARGFALAQMLNVLGLALVFSGMRKKQWILALAGGLALGAASFSNYLACFTAFAVLLWLLRANWRLFIPAAVGFAVFVPGDMYFFLAQKASRIGQFTAFSLPHALALLLKDFGAALFGGLPLYAGRYDLDVAVALGMLFYLCLWFVWQGCRPAYVLFAMAAAATPLGLLALGIVFGNTPIEIRYLAFAMPFVALLFAGLPKPLLLCLLIVEAAAMFGLATAMSTMQPQGIAARRVAALQMPAALVLLPYGNDGVGVPGPFIAAAPDNLRLALIKPEYLPDISAEQNIILVEMQADAASRAASSAMLGDLSKNQCLKMISNTQMILVFKRICPDLLPGH